MITTAPLFSEDRAGLRATSIVGRPRAPTGPSSRTSRDPVLEFVVGDITREISNAIVNPAGAGLVDLAIRRASGPGLLEAFHESTSALPARKLSPGRAILTPGFRLPAGHVIHCGPPVYADDPALARENLASCYVESLRLARARGFTSISFPAIATGIYRYPAQEAAEIAVQTVFTELHAHAGPRLVRFVLFDSGMLRRYLAAARHDPREAASSLFVLDRRTL